MKLFISIALVLSLVAAETRQKKKTALWDFSRQDSLVTRENISGIAYQIQSNFQSPEYVKGIDGDALRLDGYSTFITGNLPEQRHGAVTLTGWFALETFPTDTAGFFSLSDDTGKAFVSATVDLFGRPMIGISHGEQVKYVRGTGSIGKFKWIHVALVVNRDGTDLWINNTKIASAASTFSDNVWSQILIGRDHCDKFMHRVFPVSRINGLVDEVALWDAALDENDIRAEYSKYDASAVPDLAVPAIRFKSDFNRPKYHLLPAANWTNETHGLVLHKGRYHIFNQKNGTNLFLGQINWGHFSSPDLIHWTEHKPALTPDKDYDFKGIWSGHVVIDDMGKPVIAYTATDGKEHGISFAYPKDEALIEWVKDEKNPLVNKPKNFSRIDMRDPYIWKEGNEWYMIVGYGVVEHGVEKGSLLLYKSKNLKQWNFVHNLFAGDPQNDDSGIFWEMPVFWKLDGKYILLVNKVPQPGKPAVALYWVGKFQNERFIPDHKLPRRLELINRMLSPSVALDEKGRTVAIAIIPDETSAKAQLQQGWTHLYSIPRIWSLEKGKLVQKPIPELSVLRGKRKSISARKIEGSEELAEGKHQLEISMKVKPVDCNTFGFVIGENRDGSEQMKIYYDFRKQEMIVDSRQSSADESIPKDVREGSYALTPGTEIDLHVFIDGSVVEVFINDEAFTTRFFPRNKDSNIVKFFSEGGATQILDGNVWELNNANITSDW